jgi:hypothetical protein
LALGDSWQLAVELHPRWGGGAHQYQMNALVLGPENVKGVDCIKVDFLIPGKPPAGLVARHRVFVDPKDGWPRRAFTFRDYRDLSLEEFGGARMVTAAPEGFPIEILPPVSVMEVKGKKAEHTFELAVEEESDGTTIRTATIWLGADTEIKVSQSWKAGAKWWDHYERYRNGELELRAAVVPKRVASTPAPPAAAKAASPPTAVADPKPKPKPPPFVDDTHDTIKDDPALQVKVTLELRNPRLPHLLERLQEATGLKFTADPALNADEPVFGTTTFVNTPAWLVMRSVAESRVVQGRWEKRAGGYHIVAAEHPHLASNANPKSEDDAAPSRSGWVMGAVVAAPLVVAAALMLIGRWGRRTGKAAP